MDLSGNDKNKITGEKYQPVMSVTGLNNQGLNVKLFSSSSKVRKEKIDSASASFHIKLMQL